jgi:hypothetical protein
MQSQYPVLLEVLIATNAIRTYPTADTIYVPTRTQERSHTNYVYLCPLHLWMKPVFARQTRS